MQSRTPPGVYSFLDITPGEYAIDSNLPGYYLDNRAPDKLKLAPKGCLETTLLMKVDRRVQGEVRQKDGGPISGALVELVPADPKMKPWLRPVLLDISDEAGHYRISGIPPGRYYLGVNIQSTPATSYRSTPDRDRTVPIMAKAEASVQRFDLQVPRKLSLITIEGVIKTAEGKPPLAQAR